jgi:hypothetical protein
LRREACLLASEKLKRKRRVTAVGSSRSVLREATFYLLSSSQIVAMDTSGDNTAPGIIDIQQ